MGEVAEMIVDGILCQACGDLVDGVGTGYPRDCDSCKETEEDVE